MSRVKVPSQSYLRLRGGALGGLTPYPAAPLFDPLGMKPNPSQDSFIDNLHAELVPRRT
jgi:hypothetical protein